MEMVLSGELCALLKWFNLDNNSGLRKIFCSSNQLTALLTLVTKVFYINIRYYPYLNPPIIDASGSIYQAPREIYLFLPHALRCWFVDMGSCLQLLRCGTDQEPQRVLHGSVCVSVQHCRKHERVLVVYPLR